MASNGIQKEEENSIINVVKVVYYFRYLAGTMIFRAGILGLVLPSIISAHTLDGNSDSLFPSKVCTQLRLELEDCGHWLAGAADDQEE